MIKAIIIDDEINCCKSLATLLDTNCPEIKVVDICYSASSALQSIKEHNPELLFLDIEMPHMNGFDMLEALDNINFELIFTTSYDQYAIKAIRFSALDYLLKPVDRHELQKAVNKVTQRNQKFNPQQIELLFQKLNHPAAIINKIAIPTIEGLHLIPIDTIISCSSESNYSILKLKNNQKIVTTRTLKDIEELLKDYSFLRVHHSFLVNLNEVIKYIKGEGGYLIMNDGSSIDVSRSRKELLLKKLLPNR